MCTHLTCIEHLLSSAWFGALVGLVLRSLGRKGFGAVYCTFWHMIGFNLLICLSEYKWDHDSLKFIVKKAAETKELFCIVESFVPIIFHYNRWNLPFRYIKNTPSVSLKV